LSAAGTTPPDTTDERQAAEWVRRMFANIAPKYDFLNHLLSFNIDRGWRKVLMNRLAPVLSQPGAKILDLCCGTGDVLLDLQSIAATRIIGADFCHEMLVSAHHKAHRRGFDSSLIEADALQLPLAEATLDAISISFGFRNLANYSAGLREFDRVLKPGGMLAILEFSHPPGPIMKTAYGFYSRVLLPALGSLVSGSREAYAYLPESIRKFPQPQELCAMMAAAGFTQTDFEFLTRGIAALHMGRKSLPGGIRQGSMDLLAQPKVSN
jgi:demethylmenaquinone methyltransferase/2-methoxy-6-polyprenyl-1,4-benzoquinol methylase